MKLSSFPRFCVVLSLLLAAASGAQAQSITLSPAVVPARGVAGQSITQVLTLRNDAQVPLDFVMEARDLVVRDGRRVELAAGELPSGIAATAVFSQPSVRVPPRSEARVEVTLTLPGNLAQRAVHVYFRGAAPVAAGRSKALMSLGTLFTFVLGSDIGIESTALQLVPPDASHDLTASFQVANAGSEPVEPSGVMALLDEAGQLRGKVGLTIPRLLPGEVATIGGEYTGELAPGRYRALVTLDADGATLVRQAEFDVR